jgi:GR25 family glycosyltransferase involved in LPS biosynthesis
MKIQYYLIHCQEHREREEHIDKFRNKFQQKINIFNGIYTKNISIDNQLEYISNFNKNLRLVTNKTFGNEYRFNYTGEIGCYLSHFSIIEKIMNDKNNNILDYDYSVIFEDDIHYNDDINPHEEIVKIVKDLNSINYDFDLIFLGNLNNNKGTNIINNIYNLDPNTICWGTHALLINNKNIEKIYNHNCNIDGEIDTHYVYSSHRNELNGLVIYPVLFYQADFKSNIKCDIENIRNILL